MADFSKYAIDNDVYNVKDTVARAQASTNATNIAAQTARIDNIIAPSGAPSTAEIVDARLGDNGVTYPNLGTAIRAQVAILSREIAYTTTVSGKGSVTLKDCLYGLIPDKMTATLEPQQEGSGTPSATNIRPFINFSSISTSHSDGGASGGSGPTPSSPFYGGTQDCISGKWTLPYEADSSYSGQDLTGVRWWSDRDKYVAGTNPSIGAFVVHETTPKTADGDPWGTDPMYGGTNLYGMYAVKGSTIIPFTLSIEAAVANIGDRVDELGRVGVDLREDVDKNKADITELQGAVEQNKDDITDLKNHIEPLGLSVVDGAINITYTEGV